MGLLLSLCIYCTLLQLAWTESCGSDNDCKYQGCTANACWNGNGYNTFCNGGTCIYWNCLSSWFNCPNRPCSASAGNYCPSAASTQQTCPVNNYCLGGTALPTACPIGMIGPTGLSSATGCYLPCPAPTGQYCPGIKTSIPANCPTGFYCKGGDVSPVACPKGQNGTMNQAPLPTCTNCTNAPKIGEYGWNEGCKPECKTGYYMVVSAEDNYCEQCTNATACSITMQGKQLSRVTIRQNGVQYSPSFKHSDKNTPGRQRMFFTFTNFGANNNSMTLFDQINNIEVLAAGGGGAGGNAVTNTPSAGGGGGAGTVYYTKQLAFGTYKSYEISVGAGGKGVDTITRQQGWGTNGASGESTIIRTGGLTLLTASGGGGGAQQFGKNGGSGGGAAFGNGGQAESGTVCPYPEPRNGMYMVSPETKYACIGGAGNFFSGWQYSGRGGGATAGIFPTQAELSNMCPARGGWGITSDITGVLTPYGAGGAGYSNGDQTCNNDMRGGFAWNQNGPVMIGGSTPGGDGYPDSGSGGASAGSGTKSGSGANGVLIIAWDPVLSYCPLDNFNADNGASTCLQCQYGMFTTKIGSSTCAKCSLDNFFNPASRQCQECAGTCTESKKYCIPDGQTACCLNNTFLKDLYSTTCEFCPAGYFCNENSSVPIACEKGSYCAANSSQPEICPASSFCPTPSTIHTCTSGNFCIAGLTSPIICPNGTYCSESSSQPINCKNGSFCPEGSSLMKPCPVGHYCPTTYTKYACPNKTYCIEGSVLPTGCPADHYCPNQQSAVPCRPGTQRSIDYFTADTCQPCVNPIITSNFTWNASTVCGAYCDAGFYLQNRSCIGCYQNYTCASGQNCDATCSPGMYMPICESGSTNTQSCATCPEPTMPETMWVRLCEYVCRTGMYNDTGVCTNCSEPQCSPGEYASTCYGDDDSVCTPCTSGPRSGPFEWTELCSFRCTGVHYLTSNNTCAKCQAGTYKSSPTNCTQCTTTECAPGTYRTACGDGEVSDATCAPCTNAPSGSFRWISVCNFMCSENHYLIDNTCIEYFQFERPPPAGFQLVPMQATNGTFGFVDRANSNRVYARFTENDVIRFSSNTNATILAVGGGGAGATLSQGGGGAGAVVTARNVALVHGKDYTIVIGMGGLGASSYTNNFGVNLATGTTGMPSKVMSGNTTLVLAMGGGAGGSGDGGCGGGNTANFVDGMVRAPLGKALTANIPAGKYGFDGGAAISGQRASAGGGGAGGAGASPTASNNGGGNGGAAVMINITGTPTVYAGGGGGSSASRGWSKGGGAIVNGAIVYVGGGVSFMDKHGVPGTGSGGATSEYIQNAVAGNGGSGAVVFTWDAAFIQCENGTYSNSGATTCTKCMDGMISPARAARCTCYPGEFRNTSINQCTRCSEQKCQPGHSTKVCSIEEDLACIQCKNGTFNVDGSTDACLPCPENSKSSDGSSICSCDLEMGYYMHDTAFNACLQCPDNHFCPELESAIPCIPGTQRQQPPIDSCYPCTNLPVVGNYTWNTDITCDPQCTEGFYTLDSGEDRFCLSCFQNYTGGSPTCALGMYMPICEKGSVRKKSCAYCPTPLPAGAVWAGICDFVCDDGLYYNSTTALCTPCSQPQCVPGESVVACAKDTDTLCAQCLDGPLNGPFEWTTGCNFSCLNATFYDESNNRTCSTPEPTTTPQSTTDRPTPQSTADSPKSTAPTVKSSPIFRTSSPLITTQQDSTPMLKTTRITLAMPTSTSASKPITSTPSSSTSVRPTTTIPDTTPAITVFVQTKTEMKLNNTVQQVCANLDSLVSVVVGAMRDTFGVPFTGNISTINNQTVDTACTNTTTIRRRFLLVTPPSTNQNVTISTRALEPILEERATATILATNTTNNIIQARLGNQTTLQATSVDTSVKSTATGTPQPTPESIQAIPVLIYVGIAIGVSVLFGLICTMVFCYIRTFYPNRNTTGYRVIPVKIEADMM